MKKRILIVEDSDDIREITKNLLEGRGYEVFSLHDGDQTLKTVLNSLPNLILLDHLLTGKTGSEICHEIKTNDRTRDIPVIMTTGNPQTEQPGFLQPDDYLMKPFDIDELVEKIEHFINK